MSLVWVGIDRVTQQVCEIFSSQSQALDFYRENVKDVFLTESDKDTATRAIRTQIYTRQHGLCLQCGAVLTLQMAHMHERVPRGKGGRISLDNSEILCYQCHIDKQHGSRKPQFGG